MNWLSLLLFLLCGLLSGISKTGIPGLRIVVVAVVLTITMHASADTVTPDKIEYADKIAGEMTRIKEAAGLAEQLKLTAKFAGERVSEIGEVVKQQNFKYLPQLAAAYTTLIDRSVDILRMGGETGGLDESAARGFLADVFPHAGSLSELTGKVPEKQVRILKKAAAAAEDAREEAMSFWKKLPPARAGGKGGPVNVRIDVRTVETGTSDKVRVGIAGEYSNGRVKAKGGILGRNGLRITVGAGNVRLGISAEAESSRRNRMSNQFIVTLSGHPAVIKIGKQYREPISVLVYSMGEASVYTARTYEIVNAGASLEVLPTVLESGMIMVQVTPRLSYYDKGKKTLKLQELSTTVVVGDGQSIVIGGLNTEDNTIGKMFFGYGKNSRTARSKIILTPTVIAPVILR